MYFPSSGYFTSDPSSLSGSSSTSLSSDTLTFPEIFNEHGGEPDQEEGSLRPALLRGWRPAWGLMFALLLSCASKLEELIIEVAFKVRHGEREQARMGGSFGVLCILQTPGAWERHTYFE
jgi:hypothetical protein